MHFLSLYLFAGGGANPAVTTSIPKFTNMTNVRNVQEKYLFSGQRYINSMITQKNTFPLSNCLKKYNPAVTTSIPKFTNMTNVRNVQEKYLFLGQRDINFMVDQINLFPL